MIAEVLREFPEVELPVIDGAMRLVYEPDPSRPNTWAVNDHCLIQDRAGRIHFFGTENLFATTAQALAWLSDMLAPSERPFIQTLHKLIHGHLYRPGIHMRIGHAVAEDIWGPWKRLPAAFDGRDIGHAYACPFVVPDGEQYRIFGGGLDGNHVSPDLYSWVRADEETVWEDPSGLNFRNMRDPCILKLEDGPHLMCFAGTDARGRHTVGLASSADLRKWRREGPCYVEELSPDAPASFGIFESPFLLKRGELFYLFVGFSHRHYYETFVVVSRNPRRFLPQHKVTTVFSHAPELIEIGGETYMSSCGIEDPQCLNRSGLWMCKLRWVRP
ncbi:MAG: hypothetical protein GXP31_17800 [Kiritimatiellaeota bacterium]|nr:hypothetical protein [Kiritimatiellota bacterium]